MLRRLCMPSVLLAILTCGAVFADGPAPDPKDPRVIDSQLPDLSEYRGVETAISTQISRAAPSTVDVQPGFLGVYLEKRGPDQFVIAEVDPSSPAASAGLKAGDIVVGAAGRKLTEPGDLGDVVRSQTAGAALKVIVLRDGSPVELTANLAPTSRPLNASSQRASLGIQVDDAAEGVRIRFVMPNSPASQLGLKTGDILVRVGDQPLASPEQFQASLADRQPGEEVPIVIKRDGKEIPFRAKLAATTTERGGRDEFRQMAWDTRRASYFKNPVYRLAVVLIEYPDVKHSPKVSAWDWEQMLFSRGVYINKSATGQQVYGSLNDFYLEQSCGQFSVQGRAFDWVTVGKKRSEYTSDTSRSLLTEALDKLLAREGKNALSDFDGIFFVYAGERVQTNRGGIYWPHRSSVSHQGRRWSYFICPEGSGRMSSTSVIAHEFGHMLGWPDLYARPESPGSEGLGLWCTMSYGHGRDGKPLHVSAWCKEQLGWIKPTVIDPTVKQKLVLAPIENSTRECYKVLVRADGSEYLLLENRARRGYDRDLPGEGLLIWRIVDGKPVLEESHGIAGPMGPERYLGSVPYPSRSNNAFTPYTTPSSRSQKGGGLPVYITNIQRLPDGRITFWIGYEFF